MNDAAREQLTIKTKPEYQIMPPLSEDERTALEADIALHGVQVQIEIDEHGHILDGHHRYQTCLELGITDYPVVIRAGLTEDEKMARIRALNVARRHLTTEERLQHIVELRQSGHSIRDIAAQTGIPKSNVERDLRAVSDGTPDMPETVTGRDGKQYPARRTPTIIANGQAEVGRVLGRLADVNVDELSGEVLDLSGVERQVRQIEKREKLAAVRDSCSFPVLTAHAGDPLPMHHRVLRGDARDLVATLDEEVHCVVTSPPYYDKIQYGDAAGEIGHEPDVHTYVRELCDLFGRIPLHPRGSIWVNIGDGRDDRGSLLGVPWIFAHEMMADGWLLADEVVWAKVVDSDDGSTMGSCMPEPCIGRLNGNGHEMLFRFVKTRKASDAWTDTCAVMLPRAGQDVVRYLPPELMGVTTSIEGRNLHDVWRMDPGKSADDHWATFPPSLCERAIAMTCPPFVNLDGTLAERVVESVEYDEQRGPSRVIGKRPLSDDTVRERSGRNDVGASYAARKPITVGWTPVDADATPGVVLDPFAGTGTAGEVALKLGRSFIGFELCEDYADIASARCASTVAWLSNEHLDPRAMMR